MRIFASRQCADYVRASYAGAGTRWGARSTCYICCRPRRSCLALVVSKLRWSPPRHRPQPPSQWSKNAVIRPS